MEVLLIFVVALVVLDVTAWFWGVDSRPLLTTDRRPWI